MLIAQLLLRLGYNIDTSSILISNTILTLYIPYIYDRDSEDCQPQTSWVL